MSNSEQSSFGGSVSEAEEDHRTRSGVERAEGEPTDDGTEPPKQSVPRRPKLDADRILDNPQGIIRVFEDFPKIQFRAGAEVANLDMLMQSFGVWASRLYPYGLNMQDFARTCENELYPERHRRRIFDFRVKYVEKKGQATSDPNVPDPSGHVDMRMETPDPEGADRLAELAARMEQNRRRALEKRRQRELDS